MPPGDANATPLKNLQALPAGITPATGLCTYITYFSSSPYAILVQPGIGFAGSFAFASRCKDRVRWPALLDSRLTGT
jgi:hypothetical protein